MRVIRSIIHEIGLSLARTSNHPPESSGGKNAEDRKTAAKKMGKDPLTASTDPVRSAIAIAMETVAKMGANKARKRSTLLPWSSK